MIYLALIIAASLILGLFILLLVEIGRQNKPRPKKGRNYKPIRKASKPSLIEPNSFQNRARLRAQSQRTGKRIYSPPLPAPVVVEPEPEPIISPPPAPVVVEPEPEPIISPPPAPVVVEPEPEPIISPPPAPVVVEPEPEPIIPPPPAPVVVEPEPEPIIPPPPAPVVVEPEPEPEPEPEKLVIPDYFVLPEKPKTEHKRRNPKQFYPRLVKLLNGDERAADRLVQNLLDAYPDKSEQWCYEKALFDLTRDRH